MANIFQPSVVVKPKAGGSLAKGVSKIPVPATQQRTVSEMVKEAIIKHNQRNSANVSPSKPPSDVEPPDHESVVEVPPDDGDADCGDPDLLEQTDHVEECIMVDEQVESPAEDVETEIREKKKKKPAGVKKRKKESRYVNPSVMKTVIEAAEETFNRVCTEVRLRANFQVMEVYSVPEDD